MSESRAELSSARLSSSFLYPRYEAYQAQLSKSQLENFLQGERPFFLLFSFLPHPQHTC